VELQPSWFINRKAELSLVETLVNRKGFRTVFLKVGGITPLGAILMGKGAETPKRTIRGRKNIKGAKILNY